MTGSSKGRPYLYLTVSAVDSGDDERLQNALAEIASRDPLISINTQPIKGSHIVEGETESKLDAICDRLRDEYKLSINVGAPLLSCSKRFAKAEKRKEDTSDKLAALETTDTANCASSRTYRGKATRSSAQFLATCCRLNMSVQSIEGCGVRCELASCAGFP
jgi:translation elongation factor EF-G